MKAVTSLESRHNANDLQRDWVAAYDALRARNGLEATELPKYQGEASEWFAKIAKDVLALNKEVCRLDYVCVCDG